MESAWSAITDYYVLVDWVNPARSAILNKIELGLVIARIMFGVIHRGLTLTTLALYSPLNESKIFKRRI